MNRLWIAFAFVAISGLVVDANAQVNLGTATSFAVLGESTVTNTGSSVITGDLGLSPGTSVTGFPPGTLIGNMHVADAVALQARNDAVAAYGVLASMSPTQNLTGQNLGGLTLTPGVYHFDSSAQLTGTLTLNALGNPDSVFVFQTGSSLTTASNASIVLLNQADSCNIFWQVGSSATLGTFTQFEGSILALASTTLTTGAGEGSHVDGRVLALNGAVTLDTNQITIPDCAQQAAATPEPSTLNGFMIGTTLLLGVLKYRRRRG